jgi:hypothetical protein
VHQYLAESDFQGRQDWLAALDLIEALDPRAVVAGHKRYGNDDNPRVIDETRRYISDFDRLSQPRRTMALGPVGKGLNRSEIRGLDMSGPFLSLSSQTLRACEPAARKEIP